MALQIVAGTPGLWRDAQWTAETPGLYAMVVGVSRYPYFKGGDTPAPDTFDMGQLASSAGTAAEIFEWLRDSFRHQGLPVVWCQLLLSPTAQEKAALDARGLSHYAAPTNTNMRAAIDMWTGNVPTTDAAAGKSRTFFFYSGHGVQTHWYPLLLPSDYLDPAFGKPKLENCLGVTELLTWMDRNPVAEHLALIDACRNEFAPLASKGSTANTSFPVAAPGGKAPRTAASLSSTSPNAVAYQSPQQPRTFFGEAVLEALRGGVAGGSDARLAFRELVDYVKPRINALLQQAQPGTALDQTARQRIDGDDGMVVTEIALPAPPRAQAPGPLEGGRRPVPATAARPVKLRVPDTAVLLQATAARFDADLSVREPIPLDAMRRDMHQIRRRFGHEYASDPWHDGMALYALRDGRRVDAGGTVHAVQRNHTSSLVQVDLALTPRNGGVLLVFEGAHLVQRERLAVALPTDPNGDVPIRLSLAFGKTQENEQPKLQKIEARLGPSADNPHYQYIWELTQEAELGSLGQAATRADPARLVMAARDKVSNPTAAVAGMLLLARAGLIGDVKDWTRNLMQWFPAMPDGAVLWAESLRTGLDCRTPDPFGVKAPIDEMANALTGLGTSGAPFFADTLELAESLVRYTVRRLPAGKRRERLLRTQAWLARLFQAAMPGGHFISLAGLPRPVWMGSGKEALSVEKMFEVLGRRVA